MTVPVILLCFEQTLSYLFEQYYDAFPTFWLVVFFIFANIVFNLFVSVQFVLVVKGANLVSQLLHICIVIFKMSLPHK